LTTATYGSLKPPPAERLRRTYLHLSYSMTLSRLLDTSPHRTVLEPLDSHGFVIHEELPPFATISRFSCCQLTNLIGTRMTCHPSLHRHYSASSLLQGSRPGTPHPYFRPRGSATCGFSVCIGVSGFPRSVQLPHGKLRPPLMPDAAPPVSRYRRSYSHSSYKAAVLDIFYNVSTLQQWFPCGPLLACHLTQ